MGTAEVIRPDELASFLNIERNQMRSALEMFTQEGVLRQIEMIECKQCQMAAFLSDFQESVNEEGTYRCTACDRPLTIDSVQTITTYRRGDKWPVPKDTDGDSACTAPAGNSALPVDDSAWYTHAALANAFGVDSEALRKRLDRYRKNNLDGWEKKQDSRPREAKYLYKMAAVRPLIEDLRASGERPAK